MVYYGKASSCTLLLLVSGASAVKSGLRQGGTTVVGNDSVIDDKRDTIAEACAAANLPEYSKVAKLCKDLGAGGLDMGMDDSVVLGTNAVGKLLNEPQTFNMREILEAEDAEAAYNKIEARTIKQTERKLAVDYGSSSIMVGVPFFDYGWCSTSVGFLTGISDDSSNYCDPGQECDSIAGCGSALSQCCITHDQCLNYENDARSIDSDRCSPVNCKGATCDANLSTCVRNVSCCTRSRWWSLPSCDASCVTWSTFIPAWFGRGSNSPQADFNTDGDNAAAVCRRG